MDAPDEMADALIAFLREALDAPSLQYEKAPALLGAGAEADIYAFTLSDVAQETEWGSTALACRVERNADANISQMRNVAAVHNALAALRFRAPRVVGVGTRHDGLGLPFMVMERVRGRPIVVYIGLVLLIWIVYGAMTPFFDFPAVVSAVIVLGGVAGIVASMGFCARVLARLHKLPAGELTDHLSQQGAVLDELIFDKHHQLPLNLLSDQIHRSTAFELIPALEWLRSHVPTIEEADRAICHSDFHPGNVMVDHRGLSGVIDWTRTAIAAPEFDIGWTRILNSVSLDPAENPRIPAILIPLLRGSIVVVMPLFASLLKLQEVLYRIMSGVDADRARYFEAFHAVLMLSYGGPLFETARSQRILRDHILRATGLVIANDERRLVWVDLDGKEETLSPPPARYNYPRLSPDGSRVAFGMTHPKHIWVHDLSNGRWKRLGRNRAPDYFPCWTPDGRGLVFGTVRKGIAGDLFLQPVDSKPDDAPSVTGRLLERPGLQAPFGWSRDGSQLLFWDSTILGMGLLSMEDDHSVQILFEGTFVQSDGAISRDGRWLAYDANESGVEGDFEIFVQAFPSLGQKVQISIDGGRWPVWAPDGSALYFRNADKMMVASVETGLPTFEADAPTVLFEGRCYEPASDGRNFDIAPDGKRFLMIKKVLG